MTIEEEIEKLLQEKQRMTEESGRTPVCKRTMTAEEMLKVSEQFAQLSKALNGSANRFMADGISYSWNDKADFYGSLEVVADFVQMSEMYSILHY